KGVIEFYRSKSVDGTNGAFSVEIALKEGTIVLMAEADGYMPVLSQALSLERRRTNIELRKGEGPRGTVLLPDGKPAEGVTVCFLGAYEQASLNESGWITLHSTRFSYSKPG